MPQKLVDNVFFSLSSRVGAFLTPLEACKDVNKSVWLALPPAMLGAQLEKRRRRKDG